MVFERLQAPKHALEIQSVKIPPFCPRFNLVKQAGYGSHLCSDPTDIFLAFAGVKGQGWIFLLH